MAPYLASQKELAKDHLTVGFDPSGRYLLVSGGGRIAVFDSAARRFAGEDVAGACFDGPDRLWAPG